jgi:hypothetical protein
MNAPISVSEILEVASRIDTNKLLAVGWELIGTHTRLFRQDDVPTIGDEYIVFILGWPRSLGESKIPGDVDPSDTGVDA